MSNQHSLPPLPNSPNFNSPTFSPGFSNFSPIHSPMEGRKRGRSNSVRRQLLFSSPTSPFKPVEESPSAKRLKMITSPTPRGFHTPITLIHTELLDLPDELLEMIVKRTENKYLILQTCRRIYNITLPLIYSKPKWKDWQGLTMFLNTLTPANASMIKRLNLSQFAEVTSQQLEPLLNTTRLKRVNFTDCKNLNVALVPLMERNPQIVRLCLAGCTGLSLEDLIQILSHLSHLSTLDLSRLELQDTLLEILDNMTLKKLKLGNSIGFQRLPSLSRLVSLDLSGFQNLDADSLLTLVMGRYYSMHSLQNLNLNGVQVSQDAWSYLSTENWKEKVHLAKRSHPYRTKDASLKVLNLNNSSWLTPHLLFVICKHNSSLKSLHLSHISTISNLQMDLSTEQLRTIIAVFNNLTTLSLSATILSPGLMIRLIGSDIKNLDLSRQPALEDHHIQAMLMTSLSLVKLHLSHNPLLTDGTLYALLKLSTTLKKVNVRRCKEMTMVGVRALINTISRLEYLNVGGLHSHPFIRYALLKITGSELESPHQLQQEGEDNLILDKNCIEAAKELLNDAGVDMWSHVTLEEDDLASAAGEEEEDLSHFVSFVEGLVPASVGRLRDRRSSDCSADSIGSEDRPTRPPSVLSNHSNHSRNSSDNQVVRSDSPEPVSWIFAGSFMDTRDPMSGFFVDSDSEDSEDDVDTSDPVEEVEIPAFGDVIEALSSDLGWMTDE